MLRRVFLLGLCAMVWGCAHQPQAGVSAPNLPLPSLEAFAITARFSLKIETGSRAGSYAGRLEWSHSRGRDDLFFANPLGQGLASLVVDGSGARLKDSSGRERWADKPETLIQEALGYGLPVADLAAWLQGKETAAGRLSRDSWGRPVQLLESGWRIRYEYDDETRYRPSRITFLREQEVELRLRVEEWQDTP